MVMLEGRDREGSLSSFQMTGSLCSCYHDRLFLSYMVCWLGMSSWPLQT